MVSVSMRYELIAQYCHSSAQQCGAEPECYCCDLISLAISVASRKPQLSLPHCATLTKADPLSARPQISGQELAWIFGRLACCTWQADGSASCCLFNLRHLGIAPSFQECTFYLSAMALYTHIPQYSSATA